MAEEAHITVLAGLGDIYLHIDSLHQRCISHINGGGEEFLALLSCADQVLRSVWWVASDSLTLMREAGILNSDSTTSTTLLPETFDIDGYSDDEQRKAIATLEGVVGEMEQQIFGLVQSGDPRGADVRKTEGALLMLGYLSSIGLEFIEVTVHKFPSRPVSYTNPVPDQGPDVGHFIRELSEMYINDPKRMTEEESAFISTDTKSRTREIGQLLHDLGGMRAMQDVHDAVEIEQGRGAASMLRIAWSGIGDWPK